MVKPDLDERFRRSRLERYLLAEEEVILAQHQHWAAIAEPLASAAAGLLVVLAAGIWLPASVLTDLLVWAWIALCLRAFWKWLLWWRSWLVATDKRLLLNYGLIHEGVAMISLGRVVDLTYTRSTIGQVLGYGSLVRESSGHSQTLHEVRWVKHPDSTYLTICATIFGLEDRQRGADEDLHGHRFEDGPPEHAPGLHVPYIPLETRTRPADLPAEPNRTDDSTGIRIRYGGTKKVEREPWYQSPDMRDSALRGADTGPIRYRRPATDASDDWTPTTDQDDVGDDIDNDDDGGQGDGSH